MIRPDKMYLTKEEFMRVYPDVYNRLCGIPSVPNPWGRHNSRGIVYKGKYLRCERCGEPVFVYTSNLYQDVTRDGKFYCRSCAHDVGREKMGKEGLSKAARKAIETKGSEGVNAAIQKTIQTLRDRGYFKSDEFLEKCKRDYQTRLERDVSFKEQEIKYIIETYGGYHLPAYSCYPGTDIAFYMKLIG